VSGAAPVHQLYGTVCQANGGELKLTLRSGVAVSIETGTEFNSRRPVLLTPGRPLHVTLTIDKAGVAHAQKITPAHAMTTTTPADR
jgi:hypothetical protein